MIYIITVLNKGMKMARGRKYITRNRVVNTALDHLETLEQGIDTMPYKGDSSEDSQKVYVMEAIKKLEMAINGIEEKDFER